jgi:2-octaprenylphenol hydroxylase
VGGGPAGAALAAAAADLSVALVAHQRPALGEAGELDARVYTLGPGNVAFLSRIGAWQLVPEERRTPVHAMRVFGDREDAEIRFDAYRAGVPELAWTVEDTLLQRALWRSLEARPKIEVLAPAECATLTLDAKGAALKLHDARILTAHLVVGADGAGSWVREQAGIPVKASDYGQEAIVANFRSEKPHANTAYQWFQGGPVLALLPLPGQQISMVWSLPAERAKEIGRLEPRELCRAVEAASRGMLGALSVVTPPRSYPLRRLSAQRMIAPRTALVGDAAHVIHPLAGQGLNLALQDVRALAGTIAAREAVRDAGDPRLLRRYERARAEAILTMDGLVDGLYRLFGSSGGVVARLRNTGLNLTDAIPVLKNVLMRHAMS